MNKGYILGISLIILAVLFTIIGSTFAYLSWQTSDAQKTTVSFTVTPTFSCSADGGGNITSSQINLVPAECTNSTYAIKRTIKVNTSQVSGATVYLNMNLKVNNIGSGLSGSENFKYALTTSSISCESGIMAEGTFQGAENNTELPLLMNERYLSSKSNDTFYLWIWLDKKETSMSTQNQLFDLTLTGDCSTEEPAKKYAPWGEEVDQYTRINFSATSSSLNGQGLYLYQQSEYENHPIYYYRGAVNNNNVLFGNVCWKIVRTTETGGVKLIYNGLPTSGSCMNTTGTSTQLSATIKYNSELNSPADVGYMYGERYVYSRRALSTLVSPYKYGNRFSYSGGTYTLLDTITSTGTWTTDYNTLNNNHYTCFNNTGICSSIYYIYATTSGSGAYYITLTGGKSVENALNEMLTSSSNLTSSTLKSYIDSWYLNTLSGVESNLEDTVWCNDREIYDFGGWNPNGGDMSQNLRFKPHERATIMRYPRLKCNNINDSFTKSSNNGNGRLIYPVGLLTSDEIILAGARVSQENDSYYLYSDKCYWTIAPSVFYSTGVYNWEVDASGWLTTAYVTTDYGVRPSVSLKPGGIWSGLGTASNPYQVSYS